MTGGMASPIEIESIGGGLAVEVQERSGASPMSCFQCAQVHRAAARWRPGAISSRTSWCAWCRLGQRDEVLASRLIWECTSCQTCATRCPQQVDIAAMNDALRAHEPRAAGRSPPRPPCRSSTNLPRRRPRRGRIYEMGLMVRVQAPHQAALRRRGQGAHDAPQGQAAAVRNARGRARPSARPCSAAPPRGGSQVSYAFFPGCSLEGTAKDYHRSTLAVAARAGPGTAGIAGLDLLRLDGRPLDRSAAGRCPAGQEPLAPPAAAPSRWPAPPATAG